MATVLAAPPLDAFPGPYGDDGLRHLLAEVAELFGMELVLLGHVNDKTYTTTAVYSRLPPPLLGKGAEIPIGETYCREEMTAKAPFVLGDAELEGFGEHPGYTRHGLRAYVGAPIELEDGTVFGTLCAVDRQPRAPRLEAVERLLEIAKLVGAIVSERLQQTAPSGERASA